MKKEIIQIIVKVIVYALSLIAAYFGVTSLTSCASSHGVRYVGKGVVITLDTVRLNHDGYFKTKNFKPYDKPYD